MRELVRSLRHEHTTLISSHFLSEISETCDRLLVMRDGEIVASGSEDELSNRLLEGGSIVVTVRGDGAQAKRLLSALKGVRSVETVNGPHHGAVTTLRVDAERDIREDACRTLVLADVGILELTRSERELESIFLSLARPEGRAENGARA
jgi:ABC-2 type transport system ATP-binding protein